MAREGPDQPEFPDVSPETISPELALVDPELGARARAALPYPSSGPERRPRATAVASTPSTPGPSHDGRPYPLWARLTAALWLLVLGILIGGTAIPHAQDAPRLIPKQDEPPTTCKTQQAPTVRPYEPGQRFGFP